MSVDNGIILAPDLLCLFIIKLIMGNCFVTCYTFIMIAMLPKILKIGFRADTSIHNYRNRLIVILGREISQHLFQSGNLAYRALHYPAPFGKSLVIDYQSQGKKPAIITLLFGIPKPCFGVIFYHTLHIGVGQLRVQSSFQYLQYATTQCLTRFIKQAKCRK